MKALFLALLAVCWIGPALANDPEDLVWSLEHGPEHTWQQAIRDLMAGKHGIPSHAIASVLRRQGVLNQKDRLQLIKTFSRRNATDDPRILTYLAAQASTTDHSPQLADEALRVLLKARNPVRRQLCWPVRVNYDGRLGFLILSGSSLF